MEPTEKVQPCQCLGFRPLASWTEHQLCSAEPSRVQGLVLATLDIYNPRWFSFRNTGSIPTNQASCSLPSTLSYPQCSASFHSEKYSSSNPSSPLRQLANGVTDYKPTVRLELDWRRPALCNSREHPRGCPDLCPCWSKEYSCHLDGSWDMFAEHSWKELGKPAPCSPA